MIYPKEIKREEKSLKLTWQDNTVQNIDFKRLRENCPCATCRESRGDTSHSSPLLAKKSSLKIINSTLSEETKLEKIWSVGSYALGMQWGDGHNTGIYTYEYLASLR